MTSTTTNNAQNQNGPESLPVVQPDRNIADAVLQRVKVFEETGNLNVPKDYSAPNALKIAWLMLQDTKTADKRPVLQACTKESIANALLKMIIQGLNPAKRQCSFIAYGNQLTMQREYAGAIAIAKRDAGIKKVIGMAVFKSDEFAYEIDPVTLHKKVTKHIQTLESMESGEVKGAYAIKFYRDGTSETEIMSMAQIRKAWEQGPTKGQSPAHKNFPDQMAIKTVINRLLKIDINSSDDSALLVEETDDNGNDKKMADVKYKISENANRAELSMEDTTTDVEHEDLGETNVDRETGEVHQPELQLSEDKTGPGF